MSTATAAGRPLARFGGGGRTGGSAGSWGGSCGPSQGGGGAGRAGGDGGEESASCGLSLLMLELITKLSVPWGPAAIRVTVGVPRGTTLGCNGGGSSLGAMVAMVLMWC